jgi:hypothetical protein
MKSAIRLFLVLITLVVICFAWFTGQLREGRIQLLVLALVALTFAVFLAQNMLERREEMKRREKRESRPPGKGASGTSAAGRPPVKHAEGSFALREKKSGLTWGGGNIKASEATRGTKRKFLGK